MERNPSPTTAACGDDAGPSDAPPATRAIPWGKATMLAWLLPRVRRSVVLPMRTLPALHSPAERAAFAAGCRHAFGGVPCAVRSAAATEDGRESSHAGRFPTRLAVTPRELARAIGEIAAALPGHAQDAVLVQPMVAAASFAGVASTHRVADGAPWYCIELVAGDCAAVTAGRASGRQLAIARSAAAHGPAVQALPAPARLALRALQEVETLVGTHPVEIEFAIAGGQLTLLQARPIAAAARWAGAAPTRTTRNALRDLGERDPLPGVHGDRTVLSLMSDWNPAELLGVHPRPLAVSLFNAVIGHGVWWRARACLGYAPAPAANVALLRLVHGRALVDVRRSANSLLPAGLDATTSQRLVTAWLDRLAAEPELHDKVEFDVFCTARDFHRRSRTDGLTQAQHARWQERLASVTRRMMVAGPHGPWQAPMAELAQVQQTSTAGPWPRLMHVSRRGAIAFAMLARAAFVGEAQLRSAVHCGTLSAERARALRAAARADTACRALLPVVDPGTDGHLRASSFDVTQPTWQMRGVQARAEPWQQAPSFALRPPERRALERLARAHGLPCEADRWVAFVQFGASAREFAKFVFMRHLAAAMDGIAADARLVGLDADAASWLTLPLLRRGLELAAGPRRRMWTDRANEARLRHAAESRQILGPIVTAPMDLAVADSMGVLPNFVGHARVEAPIMVLRPESRPDPRLRGTIAAVERADPGFDWLFGEGIVGLVTAWGGANSHLAIRCAEAGLPAAIGCGESVYAQATRARRACIDPAGAALWLT